MHRNVLKVRFLNLCIINRVVPCFNEHKVRNSKLKCSPSVEKLFMQDEINRLKSINKYIKANYYVDFEETEHWFTQD